MTTLQPQEIVNQRYQLELQLGQNAGRDTWLAKDLEKGSELVVVKLLAFGGNVQWEDLKLFEREANVLKQLDHPRIPKYRDYFSIDDRSLWFGLVQEYIQGDSLREYIAKGHKFNEYQVKQIAIAILEILIYLHELSPQVLHRDIKPSNLILTRNEGETPNIYLVDFGAVQDKASAEGKSFTVVGTYGYAPMEQYGGRAVAASDLYALGATLIYLLTGLSPAELPQDDDARIVFCDRTSANQQFIKWIQKLVEPTVKKRYPSSRIALDHLTMPQDVITAIKKDLLPKKQSALPSLPRRIYPPNDTDIRVVQSQGQLRITIPNKIWSTIASFIVVSCVLLIFNSTSIFTEIIFGTFLIIPFGIFILFLLFQACKSLTVTDLEINDLKICLSQSLFGKRYSHIQFPRSTSFYIEPNWTMMNKKYNNNVIGWLIWLNADKNDDNSIKSNLKLYIGGSNYLLSPSNMRPTEVAWLIQVIEEFQRLYR